MRISILGGSSPFTVGLFDALSAARLPHINEIVLFGRNTGTMELLARYAAIHCPGIRHRWTTSLDEACDGFDVILHQIRYGGLEARGADEAEAIRQGKIADETIGPAALSTALRMRAPLLTVAKAIGQGSPRAHVINLTNPLGLALILLRQGGVPCPIGICELPEFTGAGIARVVGVTADVLTWDYAGLNHRGFLYNFRVNGQDALRTVASHTGGTALAATLSSADILSLGGVPTKYFSIFRNGRSFSAPGRAESLMNLRNRIEVALKRDPTRSPPPLAERDQPWWNLSVVPLLRMLGSPQGGRTILNLVQEDGLAREGWCSVSSNGAIWQTAPSPPVPIRHWIERFTQHERKCRAMVLNPSEANIAAAVATDPCAH